MVGLAVSPVRCPWTGRQEKPRVPSCFDPSKTLSPAFFSPDCGHLLPRPMIQVLRHGHLYNGLLRGTIFE